MKVIVFNTVDDKFLRQAQEVVITKEQEIIVSNKRIALFKRMKGYIINNRIFLHIGMKYIAIDKNQIEYATNK